MSDILLIRFFFIFLSLLKIACGNSRSSSEEVRAKISIKDGIGQNVVLIEGAQKIVSLAPGFTEILYSIGCGHKIVARDRWSLYPESVKNLPIVESMNPSPENIVGYGADLVLLYFSDARFGKRFSALNLAVAVFNPLSYQEVLDDITKLGILCNSEPKARFLADDMKKTYEKIKAASLKRKEKPRVYIEIDASDEHRPWTTGNGSFMDELVKIAGGKNIFDNIDSPFIQVSSEEIIRLNPEFILVASSVAGYDSEMFFKKRPGFESVDAIKNNRIIDNIDKDILTVPGPRLKDGLQALFKALNQAGEAE